MGTMLVRYEKRRSVPYGAWCMLHLVYLIYAM